MLNSSQSQSHHLVSAAPVSSGRVRYATNRDGCMAIERCDNQYFWPITPHVSAIVEEPPRPRILAHGSMRKGAPITIWNNWPERLSNASIFPWLLSPNETFPYIGFSNFVKDWYQSACAIVYSPPTGDAKIIGSGVLVNNGNTVATARHNFNDIPPNSLCVRFFRYMVVKRTNGCLLVHEQYLDVPVIKRYISPFGLDAGYLILPSLLDQEIFNRYAKILLTKDINRVGENLAEGHYAMFHFAGGKPQVSIGKVENAAMGMKLHETIAIQAGPGASGAAILWKGFDHVWGCGISIYQVSSNQ